MNIRELILKNRLQTAGVVLSLLLLAFGVYRHYDLPDLIAEQDAVTKKAAQTHANVVNSTGLQEQLDALKAANAEAVKRMAKATDLAGNTQYFYGLQTETGVREIGLSPAASRNNRKEAGKFLYHNVTFSSVVEGRYGQILNYLEKLEGGAWFGRIVSMNVRHAANADLRGDPVLNVNLTVEILAVP